MSRRCPPISFCCSPNQRESNLYSKVSAAGGNSKRCLQVLNIMVPLLRFYFHEEVRQAAVQSLPELLRSADLAAEKGVQGATKGNAKQILDFFWPQLLDAMAKARLFPSLIACTPSI